MANTSITGNSILDGLLAQRQKIDMFNPNDAYMSFTSQVANTPNWWESLARAATAPLFMTGLRMYDKYSSIKDTPTTQAGINSDAIRKGITSALDTAVGMPQLLANMGEKAGLPGNSIAYNDPYGNSFTQDEINKPWTVGFSERMNQNSKWNNPLLAGLNAQKQNPFNFQFDWRK